MLEYSSVCLESISQDQCGQLEKVQRKAAIACTRAYQKTSHASLLHELSLLTLQTRRKYHRLILYYKMVNGHMPTYLQDLIPPTRGTLEQRYNTRRSHHRNVPPSHTEKHKNSFLPRTTRDWNSLDDNMINASSLNIFKLKLKDALFPRRKKLFDLCHGQGAVNHSRIRMGLSALNSQIANYNFIENCTCSRCGAPNEDEVHFFIDCPHYTAIRGTLMRQLGCLLQPMGVAVNVQSTHDKRTLTNKILHGTSMLDTNDNASLFKHIQTYITNSKRF